MFIYTYILATLCVHTCDMCWHIFAILSALISGVWYICATCVAHISDTFYRYVCNMSSTKSLKPIKTAQPKKQPTHVSTSLMESAQLNRLLIRYRLIRSRADSASALRNSRSTRVSVALYYPPQPLFQQH